MKNLLSLLFITMLILSACEEKTCQLNDSDIGIYGNIIGKVMQNGSEANVYVSQVDVIDSALIDPKDGSFEITQLPIGNYDVKVKAKDYRIYTVHNIMVQAAGNTYVGEIDLSKVPDMISSHYPEDKAEIVYDNRYARLTISVIFTQAMDRESVEKAFSTIPASDGIFHWGQYSTEPNRIYYSDFKDDWGYDPGATITTFSKITAFSYQVAQKDSYVDSSYMVRLSTEAMDTSGNHLRFPLEFAFNTIQSSSTQNAIITTPSDGDVEVDLLMTQGIQLTFPRNMDPVTTEQAITCSPASDIIYIWPSYNQLTIYTGGVLHANTKYDISIDSTAEDMDGTKLGVTYQFSFETTSVKINNTSPQNGEVFVSESSNIYLYFNTFMQKSSVINAFSISPAVSGTLDWHNASKTMMHFTPNQDLKNNTKYTVTVGSSAKDLYGTGLTKPYTFSFIVRPE